MANPYAILAAPAASGAPSSNPYSILSGPAPAPENPIIHAGKQVASGIGNALDAQRWAVAKLGTHETDPDKQRTAERTGLGTQGIYDALGKIPVVGHAIQGASDVIQDTLTDPLTYETAGAGPLIKALGVGGKLASTAGKVGKAITDTPGGALLHDTLNWGGEVTRTHGKSTTNTVRGALNKASTVGAQTTQRYAKQSQAIVNSLSDDEKMNVRRGLNGEIKDTANAAPHTDLRRVESAPKGEYDPEFQTYTNREGPVKRYEYFKGDQPVGSVEVSFPTKSGVPHIEDIETKGGVRRQGFGASMLRDVSDHLKSLGHDKVTASPVNDASHEMNRKVWGDPLEENTTLNGNAAGMGVNDLHKLDAPAQAVLSPREQKAVTALRDITERDYKDRMQTMLAEKFNEVSPRLPQEARAPIAAALKSQVRPEGVLGETYDGIMRQVNEAMPYRKDYAPTVHEKPLNPDGTKAQTRTKGDEFDTRNMQRENVPTTDPGQLGAGFEALSKNAGSMASKKVIHESLGDLMNDDAVKKLITETSKATGNERTNTQKVADAWLKVVGYPRAATVSLTPRHAANILDLAANTVPPQEFPGFMKNVTSLAAKLVKANDEEYAELTKDGRDLGALSGDFREREAFFQNVPGLKHWTKAMNKMTWAVDEAAKTEYAKIIKRQHPEMNDLEAGGQAAERLVDYSHVSPLVKALRYVAPFGTFRGSIPGAVLGGIARNPARAAIINRASGGTLYGGKPGKNQHGAETYNPTSDIGRAFDAPQDYLRGTVGAPVQALGTMAAEAMTGNPGASLEATKNELQDLPGQIIHGKFGQIFTPRKVTPYAKAVEERAARYLNYGHAIDAKWLIGAALAGVPEARDVSEQLGLSQFQQQKGSAPERAGKALLQQATGVTVK